MPEGETRNDAILLWQNWAWLCIEDSDLEAALKVLLAIPDGKPDVSISVSPTALLRVKQHLSSNKDFLTSSGDFSHAVTYAKCKRAYPYSTLLALTSTRPRPPRLPHSNHNLFTHTRLPPRRPLSLHNLQRHPHHALPTPRPRTPPPIPCHAPNLPLHPRLLPTLLAPHPPNHRPLLLPPQHPPPNPLRTQRIPSPHRRARALSPPHHRPNPRQRNTNIPSLRHQTRALHRDNPLRVLGIRARAFVAGV